MSRPLTLAELEAEGEALRRRLRPGEVRSFEGDLGAGKTTFIQAVTRGLGVSRPATSPTYALVHRYQGARGPVFHLDCFRLRSPEEAANLDWEGLLTEGTLFWSSGPSVPASGCPRPLAGSGSRMWRSRSCAGWRFSDVAGVGHGR